MKKIGVVILNYNDAETTIKLCQRIVNYDSIHRIVVVDNNSSDNSFEKLIQLKNNKIDVINTNNNGGYSYGNNFGASYLIRKYNVNYIYIANPDVIFEERFIIQTKKVLENGKYQAVSGIMLNPEKQVSMSIKSNSFTRDLIDCTLLLSRLCKRKESYPKNSIVKADLLPGSLFGIVAEAFQAVDGFDENVFLYCEERILASRLKEKKYSLGVLTNTSFIHMHSVSIRKSISTLNQIKQVYKSRYYYNVKYRKINLFQRLIFVIFSNYGVYVRKILFKVLGG